ncbi:hypothetical protein PG994_014380 [Apiospora phragmitis]|uniref:Ecp2 effector protein-like domain-containing protein n=1 Tax=Apiospora phragmitis TaxID=2905665 RepID=A0ABR1T6J3_9PEZI
MMFSYLGAGLLAFLPSQALALPATLTGTASNTVVPFEPGKVSSDFCNELNYTDKTTASSALTSDCQALRTWANDNYGIWKLPSTSNDFTWTLQTNGTCTVVVKDPTLGSDGKVYIGNKDIVQILDHALSGSGATVEYTGTWKCGGDGSWTNPEWWIKKADSSSSLKSARAATFISSAMSAARDVLHLPQQQPNEVRQDKGNGESDLTAPFVPGNVPYTVCGNSTYDDLTTNDSPLWADCNDLMGFAQENYGEWVLGTGSDDWWLLEHQRKDPCEFVVRNRDGRPRWATSTSTSSCTPSSPRRRATRAGGPSTRASWSVAGSRLPSSGGCGSRSRWNAA